MTSGFHREAGALSRAAVRLARVEHVWTFHRLPATDVPDAHRFELEIGEVTLLWTPAGVRQIMERLLTE